MGEATSRPLSCVAGQVKEPFASAEADVTLASHPRRGLPPAPAACPVYPVSCFVRSVVQALGGPGVQGDAFSSLPSEARVELPLFFWSAPGMGQTGFRFRSQLCHLQAGWAGCLHLGSSESSSPKTGDRASPHRLIGG